MMKKYQLRNGMKVILIESHKSPVVSVQMWVRTGSADEKLGQEGISHFIEHLVFKGTRKFKVGEIAATVEASGGELNAYTSFDQTVFHVTLSKQFTETGLEVIAEMMGHPLFDEKEIDSEREVVIEEIKKNQDDPNRQASRLLFETVYEKHPYGLPVIGLTKTIQKVSKKTLVNYFNSRYVPSNMTLIVAGDIDEKSIKPLIKQYFEPFTPYKLKKITRTRENKQSKPKLAVKEGKFEESYLNFAWRIPPPDHKNIPALEILSLILGQGDSSRLVKAMRIDQPLVNSVGAGTYTPKDGGFFVISSNLNLKNLTTFLTILTGEIERILTEPPSPDEIQKSITNFESDEFYSLETVDGLARKAGYYEDLMGDPEYFRKFMKRVLAVKDLDIVKVAREYMNPQNMSITLLANEKSREAKAALKTWIRDYEKLFSKAKKTKPKSARKSQKKKRVSWKPATKSEVRIEKVVLPSGLTIILRPSFETPSISARAAFYGGTRTEPKGQDGLVELISNTWLGGSSRYPEHEIHQKIESLASNLSAFGGRNSIGLTLDTLAPFEKEAAEVFFDVLESPQFLDPVLEREKTLMLENIKAREDYPAQLAVQQFLEQMFKGHPYSKDMGGKLDTVPGLRREHVWDYWKNVAVPGNLIVALAGHIDVEYWKEKLSAIGKSWNSGERISNQFTHPVPSSPIHLFKELKKEQSHIIMGFKGLTQQDPKRFGLQLIQSVLAGQGGRLFIELRDKASLAYSISPIRMEGVDTGYFGAYIACSPDKADQAIGMLQIEFKKLIDTPISDYELDRAKRYLVGRHDIELQKNSSICAAMLFDDMYGNSFEETFHYADHIRDVTAQELQSLAKSLFSQPPIISLVGPRRPSQFADTPKSNDSRRSTDQTL